MLRDVLRFNSSARHLIEDGHRELSFAGFL
jgi:hypothetical protein